MIKAKAIIDFRLGFYSIIQGGSSFLFKLLNTGIDLFQLGIQPAGLGTQLLQGSLNDAELLIGGSEPLGNIGIRVAQTLW